MRAVGEGSAGVDGARPVAGAQEPAATVSIAPARLRAVAGAGVSLPVCAWGLALPVPAREGMGVPCLLTLSPHPSRCRPARP